MSKDIIDIHVHIAGIGDNDSGCYISEKLSRSFLFRFMMKGLGITSQDITGGNMDNRYIEILLKHIRDSHIKRVVILAQDEVYSAEGERLAEKTNFYVPNNYIFSLAKTHTEFLPGPSINPNRKDAIEELKRCHENGAVLVKWVPNILGINPSNTQYIPFYKKLVDLNIPLLCHTGYEYTLGIVDQSLGNPSLLELPLKLGVKVIAAHCGSSGKTIPTVSYFNIFRELLRRHPNLYFDTSAMLLFTRKRDSLKIIKLKEFNDRMLHGSDYPYSPEPFLFLMKIGFKKALDIRKIKSPLEKNFLIKKELGIPEETFYNYKNLLKLE